MTKEKSLPGLNSIIYFTHLLSLKVRWCYFSHDNQFIYQQSKISK